MKIAIVTSFPLNPARPHGGVEAVSINLVKGLARQPGTDVHVVSTHREIDSPQTGKWEGATLHRLPAPSQRLLSYATGPGRQQVQAFLRELAPEVVHAHDTYGLMVQGWAGPRVFTVHGFIYEDTRYGGGLSNRLRSLLWQRAEVAGWRDQPNIVSISPYVRERLTPLVSGIIHDIENPISEDCFSIRSSLAQPVIFSAAVVCQRKNTLGLVQAFQRLRARGVQARLRLAGKITEPAYGQAVRDFLQQHQLTAEVELLGAVPAAQVRAELTTASVFALVSFEEGAPMGVAEAMAAGLPVVTSNRCGMPYMIRHGETGFLVDPHDPDDAADAFQALLSDPACRQRLGERARANAADRYHPDRVAGRTLAVYRRALARTGR